MKKLRIAVGLVFAVAVFSVYAADVAAPAKGAGKSETAAFDRSEQACAERAKLFEVGGLKKLTGVDTPLKAGMKISFFGDSITMQGGYINTIQAGLKAGEGTKAMDVKLIRHGLNGGRVPTMLEGKSPWGDLKGTMESLIATDKADVVVIYLGVNDVWHGKNGTNPEDFEAGLRKMVDMGKKSGAKVALATLAMIGEKTSSDNDQEKKLDQYAEITCKVGADTGVPVANLRKVFRAYCQNHADELNVKGKKGGLLSYDGVHLKGKGCDLAAELIAQAICEAFKK